MQHQTYHFNGTPFPARTKWRAGDRTDVTWPAAAVPLTSETAPARGNARLELSGPYDSVESLKQMPGGDSPPAIASASGGTDTWAGSALTLALSLPADMRPGYYNLAQRTTFIEPNGGESSVGGAQVIRVQP